MKWERSLNTSSLKTDVMFTAKWMTKKIIRKKAENAIAYFLPIEELKNPLIGC